MGGRSESRASPPEPEDPSGPGAGGDGGDARKPFLLRLPAPLMRELRSWAAQEVRSLNGQIEYLLREAVRTRRKRGVGS
jgi:hypothetical protein